MDTECSLVSTVKVSKAVTPLQWPQFRSQCKNVFIFFTGKHTVWKEIGEKRDYWRVLLTNAESAEWHSQEIMSGFAQTSVICFTCCRPTADKWLPFLGLEKEELIFKSLNHRSVLQCMYWIFLRTVSERPYSTSD